MPTLTPYVRGPVPTLPSASGVWFPTELGKIATASAQVTAMTPQPATAAPSGPQDGMTRLARAPWRPVGGSVDAWVYFDAPSGTWKAL